MSLPYKTSISWCAYPTVMGISVAILVFLQALSMPYFPYVPLVVAAALLVVVMFEKKLPFHQSWLEDRQDTKVDILHAVVSLSLLFSIYWTLEFAVHFISVPVIWPNQFGFWGQVLIVGLVIDFSMWLMHWLSHKNDALWRLHALHHSSERLYWLNGERRHPISALLLGGPGVLIVFLLGAPAYVVGTWMAIVAIHLAFQHANVDYKLGVFRYLLAGAETHRWHHKKEYEDAQVNFGEVFLFWDHLFGTFLLPKLTLKESDVGMMEEMPSAYTAQLIWPFANKSSFAKITLIIFSVSAVIVFFSTIIHGLLVDVSLFHGLVLHPLFILIALALLVIAKKIGYTRRKPYHLSNRNEEQKQIRAKYHDT